MRFDRMRGQAAQSKGVRPEAVMEGTRLAGRRPFGFDGGARACRTAHQFGGRLRGCLSGEREERQKPQSLRAKKTRARFDMRHG